MVSVEESSAEVCFVSNFYQPPSMVPVVPVVRSRKNTDVKPQRSQIRQDKLDARYYIIMSAAANDFDRSFDYFEIRDGATKNESFLGDEAAGGGETLFDATLENDHFEFSVAEKSLPDAFTGAKATNFPDFLGQQLDPSTVYVAAHEQISAKYDDFSQEGTIAVTGSIHVRAATENPFTLVLRDNAQNIQYIEGVGACVISQSAAGDRKLRVDLLEAQLNEDVLIANYFCAPKLRPVPLVSPTSPHI